MTSTCVLSDGSSSELQELHDLNDVWYYYSPGRHKLDLVFCSEQKYNDLKVVEIQSTSLSLPGNFWTFTREEPLRNLHLWRLMDLGDFRDNMAGAPVEALPSFNNRELGWSGDTITPSPFILFLLMELIEPLDFLRSEQCSNKYTCWSDTGGKGWILLNVLEPILRPMHWCCWQPRICTFLPLG